MIDRSRQEPLRLQGAWSHLTLDAIAETASRARPSRGAFTDAPDRESFTDGAPRRLTSGDLGREIRLFARKMMTLGLARGDRVLILLPNIVEGPVAILGLQLAGLVPCPLSVVTAADDIRAAAERVQAAGIVTVGRYAHLKPARAATEAASRYYGIRFVAAFGERLPPGVIPLSEWPDDDISADTLAQPQPLQTALLTFDAAAGFSPIQRTHAQVISEALAVSAISGLTSRGNLLGTFTPVTAAGVISSFAAPLIAGAHVHLHGPFQPDTLTRQLADSPEAILILPSAAETAVRGLLRGQVRDTIVINREPGAARPAADTGRVTELVSLGEWATWALLRDGERKRLRLPRSYAHPVATALPRALALIQSDVSPHGRLAVSGPGIARRWDTPSDAAVETEWSAQGDGPQHLTVSLQDPAAAQPAETIAA